jgi:beta-glucanase (GH16 family)
MRRRVALAGAVLVALVAGAAALDEASQASLPAFDSGDRLLVFSEEFDGDRLDERRWVTCYWWDRDGCTNAGNEELQWYLPGNVAVADGTLRLTARRDQVEGGDGEGYEYTSGLVSTGRSVDDTDIPAGFAFTYGYAEIRARVPAGTGLWPAFWLLPVDHQSRPEIDVVELLGDETDVLRMHFHFRDDGERRSVGTDRDVADLAGGWHTYGLDWSPDHLVWYLDGAAVWRFDEARHVPDQPMYLILNLAVGGDYPGPPDETTRFPATFEIDYVRVWKEQG